MRKIFLRAQNVRAQYVSVKKKTVSKNVSENVTLQNYERRKCCFKKSEWEKGNSWERESEKCQSEKWGSKILD